MGKKTILYALLVLFIAGASAAYYAYHEFYRQHDDISNVESAFDMEAVQLIREFTAAEQSANARYLGKALTVSGMVKSIDINEGLYTVSLGNTTDLASVRCSLDSLHSNEAVSLQVGAQIAVKGYCSGFNADELLGSDVILSRCAIETVNSKK